MQGDFVMDDICYLDLNTWTWSRPWKFVQRFDHTAWVWNSRLWVFGGMDKDTQRTSDIMWLDLQNNPAFLEIASTSPWQNTSPRRTRPFGQSNAADVGSTGYAANSGSLQAGSTQHALRNPPIAPGTISSLSFLSSPNLPPQNSGTHFHVFSSGCLIDFATPGNTLPLNESSLAALDLENLRWQRLAEGKDVFNPAYRWHYCAMNEEGTHAWLLGTPSEGASRDPDTNGEFLSEILPLDLRKLGLLGNSLAMEHLNQERLPASDATPSSFLSGIGADLARTFDRPPEQGSGTDFVITAEREDNVDWEDGPTEANSSISNDIVVNVSQPIHVHQLILSARWPHFARMYAARMSEYHSRTLHIPEPYSAVRAFLYYLYSDSITTAPPTSRNRSNGMASTPTQDLTAGPSLFDVAGMLVMANIYDMPRLRDLCVHRLGRELDIEHAAIIWERAGSAQEEFLRRQAAAYCFLHWGRVVRTNAFKMLSRKSLIELCEEVDIEGRVLNGDQLEVLGAIGGGQLGSSAMQNQRKGRRAITNVGEGEEEDDEGMDVN
jgi:hypothetical protein